MMLRLRDIVRLILLFATVTCTAQTVAGHRIVPLTGVDVLRAMHDRYASKWYSTIAFSLTNEQLSYDGVLHSEKLYEVLKLPGRLRVDVGVPASDKTAKRKVFLFTKGKLRISVPGKPLQVLGIDLLLALRYDVYKQPVELTVAQLTSQGYDLSRVHDGVWHGRPVYIVGAAPGDVESQQFWIDSQRLLLIRVINPLDSQNGHPLDVVLSDYRPIAGGWIAMEGQTNLDGSRQSHEKFANVRANIDIPDSLFNLASIR